MSRSRSPKIAQLATTAMSIPLLLESQVRALQSAGYDVLTISGADPWLTEVRARAIPHEVVRMERELHPFRDLTSLMDLVRVFRRERFDIVNTHTPKAGLLGPLAAQLAGVPIVIHTVHGLLFHSEMKKLRWVAGFGAEFFTAKCSDYLFFQSREDFETAIRLRFAAPGRCFYVGNGIDLERFDRSAAPPRERMRRELGFQPEDFVVGMVGRLVYEKGIREFVEAARVLTREDLRWKFVVIGPFDPNQHDALSEAEAARIEERGEVRFLGLRKDVRDLYPALDLFVLPSHREGIPRALMEASAMGVPVIATDIRGIREVVSHARTGWLIPVHDSRALSSAIRRLRTDSELREQLAEAGSVRVRREFDRRLCEDRIAGAIAKILEEKRQSVR